MTNEQLLDVFYDAIVKSPFNKSENTRKSYMKAIKYMLSYLDNKSIVDITKNDIKCYLASMTTSDSTYNAYLSGIRTLYNTLAYDPRTEDIITLNPTNGIVKVKVKEEAKIEAEKIVTANEYANMIKNAKNSRDRAIISVLFNTGMRLDEVLSLTLKQYMSRDKDNGIILTHTKGSKQRRIYLKDDVIKYIEQYLLDRKHGADTLFVSNCGNKVDSGNFRKTIKVNARRSGMVEDRTNQIHCHLARKTYGTNLVNKGINIEVVSKVLGHSSISTTSKYYIKSNNEIIKQAMCV